MKLRTRLILVSATVTTISTLLIGGFAVATSHTSQVALLDKSLNLISAAIHRDSTSALSEALYAVQQSDVSLTLVYVSASSTVTLLNQGQLSKVPSPNQSEITKSYLRPRTHVGVENYRFRAIPLSQGEYILIAGSIKAIDKQYHKDRLRLFGFTFSWLFLAILVTWFYIRRDIKKIENLIIAATDISSGNTSVDIPSGQSDSEIDQLSDSLHRMVVVLRRATELEEAASRRMQDFLGDASHELRTPLTVIRGYVELLSGTQLAEPADRKRALARVTAEIQRMEELIKDLLFLGEFGLAPELSSEKVDFSDLLRSHVGDFQVLNPQRRVESEIGDAIWMQGSQPHLARLFTNIFGNISRHTPTDAPVRVTLFQVGKQLELTIEDGGPGLPEKAYQGGVQSFQRFDKSRSRENGGSGLGMSIIFAIVNEHRGKVILGKSSLGGLRLNVFFDNLEQ